MSFLDRAAALARRLWGPVAAAAVALLYLLLRRRTAQLRSAAVEAVEEKENCANGKADDEIQSIEKKVEADEKDRVAKARLLRHLLDDGNDDSGR